MLYHLLPTFLPLNRNVWGRWWYPDSRIEAKASRGGGEAVDAAHSTTMSSTVRYCPHDSQHGQIDDDRQHGQIDNDRWHGQIDDDRQHGQID